MAERRYGFRFSLAEGSVIVVSMIGAAFLVFLFGVYAGRELEARKNAENTRTVRINTLEKASPILSEATNESLGKLEESKDSAAGPPVPQEAAKTVVVVTPQKQNQTSSELPVSSIASSSSTPPTVPLEKEELGKTEVLKKAPPILVRKTESPPPTTAPVVREQKPVPREQFPSSPLLRKPQSTGGGWSVQLHATRDENSARQVAGRLRSQGYAPVVSKIVRDGDVWYRVRVGSFRTAEEARASVERFRREGKFSQAYPVSN